MKELQLVDQLAIAQSDSLRAAKNNDQAVSFPEFRPGDIVKIGVRVIEGSKERIQYYQGIVIARRGSGVNETFRVRKISNGIGVERIFPLHSPNIQSIQVMNKGSVRRAKLYYLRGMTERQIRHKTS